MFKKWLRQIGEKMGGSEKQKNRFGLIIILGGVGLLIMILSSFFNVREKTGPNFPRVILLRWRPGHNPCQAGVTVEACRSMSGCMKRN